MYFFMIRVFLVFHLFQLMKTPNYTSCPVVLQKYLQCRYFWQGCRKNPQYNWFSVLQTAVGSIIAHHYPFHGNGLLLYPLKHQKNWFSGCIKRDLWYKMGLCFPRNFWKFSKQLLFRVPENRCFSFCRSGRSEVLLKRAIRIFSQNSYLITYEEFLCLMEWQTWNLERY